MKISAKVIIISSILGFINALYLNFLYIEKTYFGSTASSFCDINKNLSCSEVILSPFVKFFGIPFFMIASFVYPALAILAFLALKSRKPGKLFLAIALLSTMGMTMNIVYMQNEYSFVGAICILCLICLAFIITNLIAAIRGLLQAGIK
jgi:uncharacterized membrane protein